MHIRAYEADDAEPTRTLFKAAVRRSASGDYNPAQVQAWASGTIDLRAWETARSSRQTWVVEKAGVVVGFSDLEPDGHLDMLYVHPDHGRQGIASRLLVEIEKAAREAGMDRLYAEASITALPVFTRHNFRLVAPQEVELGGQHLANYQMEKRLTTRGADIA